VRRECQSHFDAGAFGQRTIEIKEDAASANVLSFRHEFASSISDNFDGSRKTHIEAPHDAAVVDGARRVGLFPEKHSYGPQSVSDGLTTFGLQKNLLNGSGLRICGCFARNKFTGGRGRHFGPGEIGEASPKKGRGDSAESGISGAVWAHLMRWPKVRSA
jgi:hypothetical protein